MGFGYLSGVALLCVLCSVSAGHGGGNTSCPDCSWSKKYGYERAEFDVAGDRGFAILPPEDKRRKRMPWVWYAPTFIGMLPNESNGWIAGRLLAKGIAICGVDVGESYGNPQGRAAYTEFHKFVVAKFGLSRKPCLWAQSRGGLMLFNWAAEHPDLVKCIGATYPVVDMRTYPGLATACSAYGMTESEIGAHLAEHNPIDRLAPLAAKKVPILLIHGDSDGVVPLEQNSAELARRYEALGGPVELILVKGKGHVETPEFFERQEMVDFFVGKAGR
ncbi:MAG: prolyl oligopeptidase family serine peptidase [Armatimonadota bacterium]|nr:prolyl oligopeptidase family serine peptidase [Armatimonadota bacterium]